MGKTVSIRDLVGARIVEVLGEDVIIVEKGGKKYKVIADYYVEDCWDEIGERVDAECDIDSYFTVIEEGREE